VHGTDLELRVVICHLVDAPLFLFDEGSKLHQLLNFVLAPRLEAVGA